MYRLLLSRYFLQRQSSWPAAARTLNFKFHNLAQKLSTIEPQDDNQIPDSNDQYRVINPSNSSLSPPSGSPYTYAPTINYFSTATERPSFQNPEFNDQNPNNNSSPQSPDNFSFPSFFPNPPPSTLGSEYTYAPTINYYYSTVPTTATNSIKPNPGPPGPTGDASLSPNVLQLSRSRLSDVVAEIRKTMTTCKFINNGYVSSAIWRIVYDIEYCCKSPNIMMTEEQISNFECIIQETRSRINIYMHAENDRLDVDLPDLEDVRKRASRIRREILNLSA